jgi:hypothetical protein
VSRAETDLPRGDLTISVRDRRGNLTRIVQMISIGPATSRR